MKRKRQEFSYRLQPLRNCSIPVEKMSGVSSPVSAQSAANQEDSVVSFNQDEIAQDLIDEDEIPF